MRLSAAAPTSPTTTGGDQWEQMSGWLPDFYTIGPERAHAGSLPWFAPYWLPSQAAGSAFWARNTALGVWALLRRRGSNSSSLAEVDQAGAWPTLADLRHQVDSTDSWRSAELARAAAGLPFQHRRSWQWSGLWSLSGTSTSGPHMPLIYMFWQLPFLAAVLYFFYTAVLTAQTAPQQAATARPTPAALHRGALLA